MEHKEQIVAQLQLCCVETVSLSFTHVFLSERFSRILVDTVGADKLKSWVRVNRGAMVLCRSVNTHTLTVFLVLFYPTQPLWESCYTVTVVSTHINSFYMW